MMSNKPTNLATTILAELAAQTPKMGDLKKRAQEIKIDHSLAQSLWDSGHFYPRLLAVLIFDKKQLNAANIVSMANDMRSHDLSERNQISEWMMVHQLLKSKPLTDLLVTWQDHQQATLRRLFWYHQARLRWLGKTDPYNPEM